MSTDHIEISNFLSWLSELVPFGNWYLDSKLDIQNVYANNLYVQSTYKVPHIFPSAEEAVKIGPSTMEVLQILRLLSDMKNSNALSFMEVQDYLKEYTKILNNKGFSAILLIAWIN